LVIEDSVRVDPVCVVPDAVCFSETGAGATGVDEEGFSAGENVQEARNDAASTDKKTRDDFIQEKVTENRK
jgi:hypothetical protein